MDGSSHLPAGATSSDGTAGSDNQSTADDAVPEDPSRPVDDGTAHGGSPDDHTQPADGERLAGQQTASGAQDGGRQQNSPTPQAGSPHAEADSPGSADRQQPASKQFRRRPLHLPTRDETLASVARLPPAVLLGKISREDAMAVRSILDMYLRHLGAGDRAGGAGKRIDVEKLAYIARNEPSILDVIEPLLSDEQIEEMLGVGAEDQDNNNHPSDDDELPAQ